MSGIQTISGRLRRVLLQDVRTAVAARVEDYRPGPQEADVLILVGEEGQEGDVRVPGCPVIWPAGYTRGLEPGDEVLALVRHRSHDEIDAGEPGPVAPVSTRRMRYTDAVVLPGFVRPAEGQDPAAYREDGEPVIRGTLHVGGSGASFVLVRADLLDSFLTTIKTWLDTHLHTSGAPGSPTTPPVAPSPASGDLSAADVKVTS